MVKAPKKIPPRACATCHKRFAEGAQALFVEDFRQIPFDSEECIYEFFQGEISRLEATHERLCKKLNVIEVPGAFDAFDELKYQTLQAPQEIFEWDSKLKIPLFTLIAAYEADQKRFWNIVVTTFIQAKPSFLLCSFFTDNEAVMKHYQKGKSRTQGYFDDGKQISSPLASETEAGDLSPEDVSLFDHLLTPTLEDPEELWQWESSDEGETDRYTFIKQFNPPDIPATRHIWYVVVGQEASESDELEVIEHFPTLHEKRVERYRKGVQKLKGSARAAKTGTLH